MKNPFANWTEEDVNRHNERVRGERTLDGIRNMFSYSESNPRRIKQRTKPLMNKLEAEWFGIINSQFPNYPRPRAQAKRYMIANGVGYTPDFTASDWPCQTGSTETAWEVKGPHAFDGALDKLKMAAAAWPEVRWILVWKENGKWCEQEVLP